MKKFSLLLLGALLTAGSSFGYDFKLYPGIAFSAMSPDGKYLVYGEDYVGTIIFNAEDSTIWSYAYGEVEDSLDGEAISYGAGMGNVVNAQGMVVGACTQRTAAYWQNGAWTPLPGLEGVSAGLYTQGNGVSADGSVICGCLGVGNGWLSMLEEGGTSYLPGVWTKQADGSYKCELLPYPTKDFTGRAPQYVTAICVSDDGNTIAGQVRGYDGFATYPIIYTRDAEGKWSYKVYGLEYIINADVDFPTWPSYEPRYPQPADYITEEQKAAYEEAMEAYNDSVDMYGNGLIDSWPTYPSEEDFLSEEAKADFVAARAKYEEEYQAYADSCDAFDEIYHSAITGSAFVYNTVSLSANGRYLAQTLESEDPNADPFDSWGSSAIDAPVLFDLANGQTTVAEATSMQPGSVTNDGMMVASSPSMEYSRQAYVIPNGEVVPVPFLEWLSTCCDTASIWIKQNMAYDVLSYAYDEETDEYTEVVYEDSVQTGTLICNPEGTIFSAYTYDQWTEDDTNVGWTSYVIDITDPNNPSTGIASLSRKGNANGVKIASANGTISVDGNVTDVCVFDMSGRKVATANGNASVNVSEGLYMVKAVGADGNVVTKKVTVNK